MGFPVQNKGTTSFRLEAPMLKCKQSVHSRLCGNDMETSIGVSAEIRGDAYVWERVNLLLIVAFGSLKLVIKVKNCTDQNSEV